MNDANAKILLDSLKRHVPLMLAVIAALLAGRALKRMFWTAFGMYWALRASGVHW